MRRRGETMLALEDIVKAEPGAAIAVGLLVLAAPVLVPSLRPELRPILKSAAKLFVEAEFGADGAIIEQLADAAIDDILDAGARGSEPERNSRIEARVQRFTRRARHRAQRMGRDEADRQARYRRHVHILQRRLSLGRARKTGTRREALDHAATLIEQLQV